MGLDGENAVVAAGFLVVVKQNGSDNAVDFHDEKIALGRDLVVVPVFDFERLLDGVAIGEAFQLFRLVIVADFRDRAAMGQDAAIVFAIDNAGISVGPVKVGLVAVNPPGFRRIRVAPGAKLHPGVALLREPNVKFKNEIFRHSAFVGEELVVRQVIGLAFLAALADNAAVFDRPYGGAAIPTLEGFAVEERSEAVIGGNRRAAGGEGCHSEKKRKQTVKGSGHGNAFLLNMACSLMNAATIATIPANTQHNRLCLKMQAAASRERQRGKAESDSAASRERQRGKQRATARQAGSNSAESQTVCRRVANRFCPPRSLLRLAAWV